MVVDWMKEMKKITYKDLMAFDPKPCKKSLPFIEQTLNCSALGFLKYTQKVKGFKPEWASWTVVRPEYISLDAIVKFAEFCSTQAAGYARYARYAREAGDAGDAGEAARYARLAGEAAHHAARVKQVEFLIKILEVEIDAKNSEKAL